MMPPTMARTDSAIVTPRETSAGATPVAIAPTEPIRTNPSETFWITFFVFSFVL